MKKCLVLIIISAVVVGFSISSTITDIMADDIEIPAKEVEVEVEENVPKYEVIKREAKPKVTWYVGYTNNQTEIVTEPSEVIDTVRFNTRLKYTDYNDEYYKVRCEDGYGYVRKNAVANKKFKYKTIKIKSHGFKSYTSYRALTRKSSLQYKLQQEYAYTGDYGIRMVNGRFCIAVGTGVCKNIGQYIDVILENGTLIPCIMADEKADIHTKADRITTAHNLCVCEFYLDTVLPEIKEHGDVSYACEEWRSPVCEFRVYDVNVFDEEK